MPINKIKKEPKVSASSVSVSPGQQLDATLAAMSATIDTKAGISDVAAITGSRSDLGTTDKTNLVAAINEVNNKVNTDNDYNNLTNKPIEKTEDDGYVVVAFGNNRTNQATAQNAFAEGGKNKAKGNCTHAEGFGNTAEGSASHAEGTGNNAIGAGSHAEGQFTIARGDYSHAEGMYTETVQAYAHAEGDETVAYGRASHAEGSFLWAACKVSRAYTAEGRWLYVEEKVDPGYVILYGDKTIGVQSCSYQSEQGDYSLGLDDSFDEDIAAETILDIAGSAYGASSHVEGYCTTAKGNYSHAEGFESYASGAAAHAEGANTVAQGNYTHAEGFHTFAQNTAEHACGQWNKSTGLKTIYSVGIGTADDARVNLIEGTLDGKFYVKGIGNYDGTNVNATGVKALGEAGWLSISYGDISGAPIQQNEGEDGYVLGTDNHAAGLYSFAQGNGTYAIGDCSHAEGAAECVHNSLFSDYTAESQTMNLDYIAYVGNIIIVDNQIAKILSVTQNLSYYTVYLDKSFASDISESTTIEIYPCASGTYSHTEGFNSMASGVSSHAEGYNTKAQGTASHAEGDDTEASGGASHAEGYKSEATADCAHAEGRMTHATANAAHAEGQFTYANGKQSHAEGSNSTAGADRSHAEGYHTTANGTNSHAEGTYTLTRNTGEHACGNYNKSTSNVTLFSIGCGYEGQSGSPDTHQNAFEVDKDGNVYIKGIGNYDGTNIGATGVKSVQQVIAELSGNNS